MMPLSRRTLIGASVLLVACSSDAVSNPRTPTGVPRKMVILWTPKPAPAGSTVAGPAAQVLDENEFPVSGVTVTWLVASGGGTLIGSDDKTDSEGIAHSGQWRLGDVVGTQSVTASVAGLSIWYIYQQTLAH